MLKYNGEGAPAGLADPVRPLLLTKQRGLIAMEELKLLWISMSFVRMSMCITTIPTSSLLKELYSRRRSGFILFEKLIYTVVVCASSVLSCLLLKVLPLNIL